MGWGTKMNKQTKQNKPNMILGVLIQRRTLNPKRDQSDDRIWPSWAALLLINAPFSPFFFFFLPSDMHESMLRDIKLQVCICNFTVTVTATTNQSKTWWVKDNVHVGLCSRTDSPTVHHAWILPELLRLLYQGLIAALRSSTSQETSRWLQGPGPLVLLLQLLLFLAWWHFYDAPNVSTINMQRRFYKRRADVAVVGF